MLHDNETKTDLLSYEPIANTIAALLMEPPYAPVTIGVHGDWGAGKSSILEMVAHTMEQQDDFLTLKFNGWRYQGFEDAKISLLETIVEELIERRPALKKYGAKIASIWNRINWLKVAKKVASTAAIALTAGAYLPIALGQSVADKLKPGENEQWLADPENAPSEIRAFRKEFDELLDLASVKRLIVLIDDLDRCLPTTTIETLEAVRLFLFTSKTAFVVAADEAMVEYCVRHHFPSLPEHTNATHFAKSYLEKLIQIPFRIPALGVNETRLYTSLLLIEDRVGSEHDLFTKAASLAREQLKQPWNARSLREDDFANAEALSEISSALSLADQIGSVLAEGTQGNPRQVKRFLITLLLRHRTATARGFGGAIQLNALAKLMLAERFQPRVFDQIERSVAGSGVGMCHELMKLEDLLESPPASEDVKETPDEGLASQWYSSEEVLNWARITPNLGGIDLRPYFFITRDRKRAMGTMTALGELDAIVQKLLGSRMTVRSLLSEVKKLSPSEQDRLFESLKVRVQSAASIAKAPAGIWGLALIAEVSEAFAPRLLDVLESMTVDSLGTWPVTGWGTVFASQGDRFPKLLQRWSKSEANKTLAKAAEVALAISKKGKK